MEITPDDILERGSASSFEPSEKHRDNPRKKSIWSRFLGMCGRCRRWFSNWLNPAQPQRAVLYPPHRAEDESIALDLQAKARRSGQNNLPRTEQTRETSALEQAIDSHIVGLLNDARTRASRIIVSQEKAFRKISTAELTSKIDGVRAKTESEFKRIFMDETEELENLSGRTRDTARELSDFRQTHARHYPANYPESQVLGWAILSVILIAETALNALFFAEGSDLGLLGGAGYAFSLAFVNIATAGLVAHYPIRWLFHRNTGLSLIGGILFLSYAVCLSLFLLFISKYRHAFATVPDEAFVLAIQAFHDGSLFPDSETSLIFLLLSFLFAVIALFDVFRLDDAYPGYGRIQRRWELARNESQNRHEEISETLESLRAGLQHEQDVLQKNMSERLNWLESISANCEQALTGWQPYVERVRQLRKALLASYRECNMEVRNTESPAWFSEDTPLSAEEYRPPRREVPDTEPVREVIRELQLRTNDVQVLLLDQYSQSREKLNSLSLMQEESK